MKRVRPHRLTMLAPATVTAGLAALVLVAAAVANPSATERCGRGAIPVKVNGRSACLQGSAVAQVLSLVRAGAGIPSASSSSSASMLAGLAVADAPHGVSARLVQQQLGLISPYLWLKAASARDALASSRPKVSDGPGIDIPPGSGEVGSGAEQTRTVVMPNGSTGSETQGRSGFATACPDGSGYDPARATQLLRTITADMLKHRLRLVTTMDVKATAKAIGHVAATGQLRDFDAVIDVVITVDVRVLGPAGLVHGEAKHQVDRARLVFVGLDPHNPVSQTNPAHLGCFSLNGSADSLEIAPGGTSFLVTRTADLALAEANMSVAQIAEPGFRDAEHNFFDEAKCLKATFSPSSLRLKAGTSKTVTVSATSTVDGAPTSIDATLTPFAALGTVTPTQVHIAPSPTP